MPQGLSPSLKKTFFFVQIGFSFWAQIQALNHQNTANTLWNIYFCHFLSAAARLFTPSIHGWRAAARQLRRRLLAPQAKQKWQSHADSTFSFEFYTYHMLTNTCNSPQASLHGHYGIQSNAQKRPSTLKNENSAKGHSCFLDFVDATPVPATDGQIKRHMHL